MLNFKDLKNALIRIELSLEIAKSDLRKSYNRTKIGPFWETISLGILLTVMSIVWSQIIKSDSKFYIIYLVSGVVIWRYISQILNSSTWLFIEKEDIIKYFNIPHSSLALAKVIYAIMIFFHHIPLILIFGVYCKIDFFNTSLFYLFYAFPIYLITSYAIAILVGLIVARFRDCMSLINTVTSVAIFFTPILWTPDKLSGKTLLYVVDFNIFYHYIELIRQPFLGNPPTFGNILITFIFSIFIFFLSLYVLEKFKHKVRYWV